MGPSIRILLKLSFALALSASAANITQYELKIVPDFAKKSVHIRASISLDRCEYDKELSFRLGNTFRVQSAELDSHPARFRHTDDELDVTLPTPQSVHVLKVELEATPGQSGDDPRAVIDDDSLFLLWSDAWYPLTDTQWSNVRTIVVLPKEFEVIAPGVQIARTIHGANAEVIFETHQPTLNFSVFADRRWIRTEYRWQGEKFITLLHSESQQYTHKIFAGSSDVLDYFTGLHGYYPFEQFAFVTMRGIYARRAQNGFIAYSPEYLQKEMARTGYDAHETSLLWWGYATRGDGPGAYQWFEGLGDYVEIMYSRDTHKPIPAIFDYFRREYLKSDPSQEPPLADLKGNTPQPFIHGKYPWLMSALHQELGDPAFRHALKKLFAEYRYRTFTINQFVEVFAAENPGNVQRWRYDWLDRTGVPNLDISYTVEPNADHYRILGTILQRGNLYTLQVPVWVDLGSSRQLGMCVPISGASSGFEFSVPQKPLRLLVDPENTLIMRVDLQSAQ